MVPTVLMCQGCCRRLANIPIVMWNVLASHLLLSLSCIVARCEHPASTLVQCSQIISLNLVSIIVGGCQSCLIGSRFLILLTFIELLDAFMFRREVQALLRSALSTDSFPLRP
jgi:CBS-domain-containing membrane protein